MAVLPLSFYQREDVVQIARELIGKELVSDVDGQRTAGMIVETEAYAGEIDRASHAYGRRRTKRTEIMYAPGGVAYVYLCYGIHHLFNVVSNAHDIPHAILVRALEPTEGIDIMLKRCGKKKLDKTLTAGPGNLTKALGITTALSGSSLINGIIRIEDKGRKITENKVLADTRVGVSYARDDAYLPYRFLLKDSEFISRGKGLKV